MEVMRCYSNPPGTPVDLGELLDAYSDRNTIETEIEPRQAQRPLREADVARLVEDYVAGASIDELIAGYGVNRTTVYAHLDRHGVARPRRRGKLTEEQVANAAALLLAGQTPPAIARELRIGEETVRRALRGRGPARDPDYDERAPARISEARSRRQGFGGSP